MSKLKLEILTPEKKFLDLSVDSVTLQGSEGRLGILPEHTALIAKLDFGVLTYTKGSQTDDVLCGEGMVEVSDNNVTVVVRSAESVQNIDGERAKRAYERAKSWIHSKANDLDAERAEKALKRATERIRFAKS